MLTQIKVSLAFAQSPDGNLLITSGGVLKGLTKYETTFPALPVPVGPLGTLHEAFDKALAATADGGPSATAAKNTARRQLVSALRKDALYVEIVADNDLSVLLSSGFEAASTNRAPFPLAPVEVTAVSSPNTGELQAKVKRQPGVRAFEGRIKAAGGEFGPVVSFASSRKIIFDGLTAGINYTLQLCAIGGSTGKSDWSNPVTRMSM